MNLEKLLGLMPTLPKDAPIFEKTAIPVPSSAASYARKSKLHQPESSIERQEEACQRYAEANSLHIVRAYVDLGTGKTIKGRNNLNKLLADARAGLFYSVVVEDADRLSRDLADFTWIARELRSLGVEIHSATSTRKMGIREIAIGGAKAEFDHSATIDRLRAGHDRFIDEGGLKNNRIYGYRCMGRERVIDATESATVQLIFKEFADGASAVGIAKRLNNLHIPAPRSAAWTVGTILGRPGTIAGILRNPHYIGMTVANARNYTRDPDTRRFNFAWRDQRNWKVFYRPDLECVDAKLFASVQTRLKIVDAKAVSLRTIRATKRASSDAAAPSGARDAGRWLLGLLKCGECGSPLMRSSDSWLTCRAHAQSATCKASARARGDVIEYAAYDVIRMALSDSEKPTKSVETSRRRERVLLKSPATDEARRLMRRMNRLFRSAGSRPDEDSLARQIAECATALDTARSVTQEAEKEDNSPLDSAPSGGFDSLEASINALDSAFLWRTLAYRSLEGKALVASIRASVGSIDVFMPQKRKLKPRTHLKERPKTAASEPVLCVCESAESHPPEPKEYAESARLRLLEKYHKDAVALSDAEWSAVAMEVSENVERPVRSPSCYTSREIVNFAVFASRADANLEMLPRERGSKVDLKGAMKRLVNSGSLRRIEIKLKELWPDKFKYLHAEKFSRYAYKENQKSAALAKNLEIEAKSGLGIFPSHVSDIVSSALARSGRKDLQLRLRTVEAAIFILRQSAPNSAMPPYYGGAQVFKNEMSQLVRSGAWDRVVADLKSSDLGFLEGLNLSRFDNLPRASVAPSRLREGTDFRPHGVFLEVLQNSPQALSTKELAKTVAISLGYSTDGIESKQLRSLALGSMIYWRRRGKVKKSFEHGESWSVVPGDAVV